MSNHVGVDKSATGSLLRCKINTVVSTFNIRSLNSIEKIGELTALAEEKGISVVCLQEHRKFHDSAHVHYTVVGKGRILANSSCWKKSMNSCVEGVGMLLSLSAHNSLEGNIVVVNSRIIVANFSGNPATTIICCYSPLNYSGDSDALDVYNTLSEVIKRQPGHNLKTTCGDI